MARIVEEAAALGLVCGGLWYASAWPGSQIFGRTLIAGGDPDEIALTFDDGPNETATPYLLDVLARHRARATFFAIGSFARQSPRLVRRIVAEGHLLGNHTMDHPRLSLQPAARVRREIAECGAVLEDIAGTAVKFFRPPFGARRPIVLRMAREMGLTPVLWNVTAHDWKPIGAPRILSNLYAGMARNRRRGRGSNLLLHDGGHRAIASPRMDTVHAVDQMLAKTRGTAVRFVTVDAWSGGHADSNVNSRSYSRLSAAPGGR